MKWSEEEDTIESLHIKNEIEFNTLIQQIENQTFIGNELKIDGSNGMEGEREENGYALNDNHAITLANALKKNPNITSLIIYTHDISDIGANALSALTSLDTLDLSFNNITVHGATALAKGDFKNLILRGNPIGGKTYINPDNNLVTSITKISEMKEFVKALIDNKTITFLDLYHCHLIPAHGPILAGLINNNTTLTSLDLTSNQLGDEALQYIGNTTTLDLGGECNNLDEKDFN